MEMTFNFSLTGIEIYIYITGKETQQAYSKASRGMKAQ